MSRPRGGDGPVRYLSEGHRLLALAESSPSALVENMRKAGRSCSVSTASRWLSGEKAPRGQNRRALEEAYGVPHNAWSQKPAEQLAVAGKAAAPAVAPAAAPPAPAGPPKTPLEELEETHRRLLEMHNDGELTTSEKKALIAEETKILSQKARLRKEAELFEPRVIRESAAWKKVEQALLRALEPYPDAMGAVVEALEALG